MRGAPAVACEPEGSELAHWALAECACRSRCDDSDRLRAMPPPFAYGASHALTKCTMITAARDLAMAWHWFTS